MRTKMLYGIALSLAAPAVAGAATCPTNDTVAVVMTPGFSCTINDKTFSAFDVTGVPATAQVDFGLLGPLFTVTLARDGTFFAPGRVIFDYTVTPTAPNVILIGTVGVDVSFPTVTTTTTMNGMTLTGTPITNGGSGSITFAPGVSSVVVDNTSIISAFGDLNSITNDFSQVPVGVPEPSSWALALIGASGLAFIWRRRRDLQ